MFFHKLHPSQNGDALCVRFDFVDGEMLRVSSKLIVFCQEEHAVAFMSFSHGHTGTIPVPVFCLCLLVLIVPAGAEGRSEFDLVFGQAFDDDRGDGGVGAVGGVCVFGVRV